MKSLRGRPRKYQIDTLGIGESVLIEWERDRLGYPINAGRIHSAVRQEERRARLAGNSKKFSREATFNGLKIIRLS